LLTTGATSGDHQASEQNATHVAVLRASESSKGIGEGVVTAGSSLTRLPRMPGVQNLRAANVSHSSETHRIGSSKNGSAMICGRCACGSGKGGAGSAGALPAGGESSNGFGIGGGGGTSAGCGVGDWYGVAAGAGVAAGGGDIITIPGGGTIWLG